MSDLKAVILQKNNISGKVKSGMLNLCGTVQRASGKNPLVLYNMTKF